MGNWKKATVGDKLDSIETGKTPPKSISDYYSTPTVNWYSPSDFSDDKKILSNSKNRINELAIENNKAKIYPKNSILLVGIGATIGKVGLLRERASSNQQITALKFSEDINPDFAYYWFRKLKIFIINISSSATLPIINQKGIKALPLNYPPLPEQRAIVAKLDALFERIDRAIVLVKENIAHTEALMGSVLDEELTKYKTIKYSVEDLSIKIGSGFACGKSNEKVDGYVHLRTHNIDTSGNLNFDLLIKIDEKKINYNKATLKKGDILFNNTNSVELVGKTAYVNRDYDYAYSNHLTKIKVNTELISPKFLTSVFINLHKQGYFARICKKWIGQAGVNTSVLKSTLIDVPSISDQKKIVKRLDIINSASNTILTKQSSTLEYLEGLRQSLLDVAFKGELV